MLPSVWTTTTWAWATGRELGPASTTAHWQVEAAAELQEILVIQDIVEMTIQHHAVFQKTQMLCLMKNSGCFEFWSDQRQPKLIIRWNVCWSSCKDSHVCWARLKKCQNSVCVCVYTPTCLVGGSSCNCQRSDQERIKFTETRLTMSHSCRALAPNEMMCSVWTWTVLPSHLCTST